MASAWRQTSQKSHHHAMPPAILLHLRKCADRVSQEI